MWNGIKNYFTFSKRERNGFTLMLIIILLLSITYIVIDNYNVLPDENLTQFEPDVQEFIDKLEAQKDTNVSAEISSAEIIYFEFNPNKLPQEEWRNLGLQDWQIVMIYKYESKGGTFRSKADVLKMYCIDTAQYLLLEPYILLPTKAMQSESDNSGPQKFDSWEPLIVNINTATADELISLWGIGETYADRIIRYRTELGGFHSAWQLIEVYGVEQEVLDKNEDQITASGSLQKMNINILTAKELQEHPYLDWNAAGHIVQWREANGSFSSIAQLRDEELILAEIYSKIAPYLSIE